MILIFVKKLFPIHNFDNYWAMILLDGARLYGKISRSNAAFSSHGREQPNSPFCIRSGSDREWAHLDFHFGKN